MFIFTIVSTYFILCLYNIKLIDVRDFQWANMTTDVQFAAYSGKSVISIYIYINLCTVTSVKLSESTVTGATCWTTGNCVPP